MIENDELWNQFEKLSSFQKMKLDGICNGVLNSTKVNSSENKIIDLETTGQVMPNRLFALHVLNEYKKWNIEVFNRP